MKLAPTMLCASALALLLSFLVESGQGPFDTSGKRRDFCQTGTLSGAQTIYRCGSAGGLVFSDRPCAADAEIHKTDDGRVTVYDAPPISKHASQPRSNASAAGRPARQSVAVHAKHQAACARLDQSLRDVRTKLRTGYGIKEGERLKTRQRQLAERRRKEKCR
jgi:hypothetical protein